MGVVACVSCGKKNRVPEAATGAPRCANCKLPLPWVVDAGDENFAEVADAATVPVLVELWAPWCGPCQMVSPVLEQLARQFAGRIKLVKVNVDGAPALTQRFSARSIPTLVLLKEGRVVARQVGAALEGALRQWLEEGLRQAG
jgi:thioredoxin 2